MSQSPSLAAAHFSSEGKHVWRRVAGRCAEPREGKTLVSMSLPCQVRTWTWIKSWQRQEVYQSLQTRPNTKDSFLKGNRIEMQGKIKQNTPMWTLQWWNLLLENRTLYSVSPVCLWWTISLQSPTGNILFVIILWHLDTTQVSPREWIK